MESAYLLVCLLGVGLASETPCIVDQDCQDMYCHYSSTAICHQERKTCNCQYTVEHGHEKPCIVDEDCPDAHCPGSYTRNCHGERRVCECHYQPKACHSNEQCNFACYYGFEEICYDSHCLCPDTP